MMIAIDYDDTLTADWDLWRGLLTVMNLRGHKLICVTARRETEMNIGLVTSQMRKHGICVPVYFTGLKSKVDVWIDDDPHSCALGH